nr:SOS response-associated peptidase [Anaerolineae bacterium]
MCGRFAFTVDLEELRKTFPWLITPDKHIRPRYNIAPTQPVAVVANEGARKLDFFIWGLIPFWAVDPKIGSRLINARGETLVEKNAFRAAYIRRRCLIFADGFYEWKKEPGESRKTPYYFRLQSGAPFAFGGLWETWHSPLGDLVRSCTIITTRPNALVADYHDRMPFILPEQAINDWLDPAERPPDQLDHLIGPYPADQMEAYAVSLLVNNPENDFEECIQPVQED